MDRRSAARPVPVNSSMLPRFLDCTTRRPKYGRRKLPSRFARNDNLLAGSDEGGDAGDALADNELVHVVGAFVLLDASDILHLPHNAVTLTDALPSHNS